ncbi:hypothetical protein [Streptomyces sp. NPDC056785]|uniref:hypothetical protein n=1 Tax=Streptomyces sp. NPDC056785 TaxID=3345944 RepID=UPI00368CE5FC
MRRADILHSITYLEKLTSMAQEDWVKDLPAEQVREALAMKEYSDYSMYEFIHFQVNIPAVLKAE